MYYVIVFLVGCIWIRSQALESWDLLADIYEENWYQWRGGSTQQNLTPMERGSSQNLVPIERAISRT